MICAGQKTGKEKNEQSGKIFPDIVVISEKAEGNCKLDEHERKRVCDNEEASDEDGKGKEPAGVSSIFKDTRRSASVAAISDEEGTVVEI